VVEGSKPVYDPRESRKKEQEKQGGVQDFVIDEIDWEGSQYMSSMTRQDGKPPPELTLGIDLGATTSCVAFWNGDVGVISDEQGHTTASIESMLANAKANSSRKEALVHVFKAIRKNVRMRTFPSRIGKVVLTSPLTHSKEEKKLFKAAATEAKFEVICQISNPVAAALGAGMDRKKTQMVMVERSCRGGGTCRVEVMREVPRIIMVFDLGGKTFDVSIVQYLRGEFSVLASAGDANFGGRIFDEMLAKKVVEEFVSHNRGANPMSDKKVAARVMAACEKAKVLLTTTTKVPLVLESFFDGIGLSTEVTRRELEQLCSGVFVQLLIPMGKALQQGKLTVKDIDNVVLAGGSSKIPKVQEHIRSFFNGRKIEAQVLPEAVVAYGAATQAALMMKPPSTRLRIGIETAHGEMVAIIPRDTELPTRYYRKFTNYADNQGVVEVRFFEGERPKASHNRLLGRLVLSDFEPRRRKGVSFTVAVKVDEEGVVSGSIVCGSLEAKQRFAVRVASEEQAREHMSKILNYQISDQKRVERMQFMTQVDEMIDELKCRMLNISEDDEGKINKLERGDVLRACDDFAAWIVKHPKAKQEAVLGRLDKFQWRVSSVLKTLAGEKEKLEDYVEMD